MSLRIYGKDGYNISCMIVLCDGDIPVKVLKKYKRFNPALSKFNKILSKNQVLFKKTYSKYNLFSRYNLKFLTIDKYNDRLQAMMPSIEEYKFKRILGWIVFREYTFNVEEKFRIYPLKKSLSLSEIITRYIKKIYVEGKSHICAYYKNKIIIHDDDFKGFSILCINTMQCEELYATMMLMLQDIKIENIAWVGRMMRHDYMNNYTKVLTNWGMDREVTRSISYRVTHLY